MRRTLNASVLGAVVVGTWLCPPASAQTTVFNLGDVMVSVGNGQVQRYSANGKLVQTLDTLTASAHTTGSVFDSTGNFYVTDFDAGMVTEFSNTGALIGPFGSGYSGSPESILVDAAGNFYVGSVDGDDQIRQFSPNGAPLATYPAAVDQRGTDWIDLAADQRTIYYTSEGQRIMRYDVVANSQLDDFANLGNVSAGTSFALRLLPDGGLLVAHSYEVVRLDNSGNVIQTYALPGETYLFALNLDPDGTSFWTATYDTKNVYKVDIASGNILLTIAAAANGASEVAGLSVFGQITAAVPALSATPNPMAFTYQTGAAAPQPQILSVTSSPGSVTFTAAASVQTPNGGAWLSVGPSGPLATPANLSVSVNPSGLAPGTYLGTITLTPLALTSPSAALPLAVQVTLTVTAPVAVLTATPDPVLFSYQIGSSAPTPQVMAVTSSLGSMAFSAAPSTQNGGSWLAVSPTQTATPANLSVVVNISGLAVGTYNGSITINTVGASSNPLVVPVTLTITAPVAVLTASPNPVLFGYQIGSSAPAPQTLAVTSSAGSLAFSAAPGVPNGGNWLAVSPAQGATPANLSVSVNVSGLAAGTYNGSITITAEGASNLTVPVTLTITLPAANLLPTPAAITFTSTAGSGAPAAQSLAVNSSAGALNFTATPGTQSGGGWLSVSPGSGTTPANLSVSVNPAGLAQGTYNGSVTLTAGGASNSPLTVPVTLTVIAMPTLSLITPGNPTLSPAEAPPNTPQLTVGIGSAFPLDIQGTVTLTVTPNTGSTDPAINIADPNVYFACSGQQNCTATTFAFTIPANSTQAVQMPALNSTGTVASTITYTVTSLQAGGQALAPPEPVVLTVAQGAPAITSACYAVVSSGLQVLITGYTTTRALTQTDITFQVAAGTNFQNPAPVDLTAAGAAWFGSAAATTFGGMFEAAIPFSVQGNAALISSVAVTIGNSVNASQSVQAHTPCP